MPKLRKAERGGHGGKGQDFSFRYVVFEIRYPGGVTEKEGGKTCLASGKDTRKRVICILCVSVCIYIYICIYMNHQGVYIYI